MPTILNTNLDKITIKELKKICDAWGISRRGKSRVSELRVCVRSHFSQTNNKTIVPKGYNCSKYGYMYECICFNVLKNIIYQNKLFITTPSNKIGGSSARNDLEFLHNGLVYGIEIKKFNTPDWMQCSLKHINRGWTCSQKSKIPVESAKIFKNIVKSKNIFNGKTPPFMTKKITHAEWKKHKEESNTWNDRYYDIPSDTINKLYLFKKCMYIQISTYGLYHLGNDICNFGTPKFKIEQKLRVRTKIHSKKNKSGFCSISVTASCMPKNIKKLEISPYSLDSVKKLPSILGKYLK